MDVLDEVHAERDMPELELALLRRGMHDRTAQQEACARCRRTPLIGERVYVTEAGVMLCELCRSQEVDPPAHWTLVHGPEFGHTLRLLERRAA
jgi:hypothetical protein